VDGGVVNNLPVDIARALGADRVLGVSVPNTIRLRDKDEEKTAGLSIQGLRRFGDPTRQWRTPFLIAGASMNLAIQLVNQRRLELCPPDLLIQVQLTNVGLFGDGNSSQVIDAGRQAALHHLPQIIQLREEPEDEAWVAWLRSLRARLRRAWRVLRQPPYQTYPEPRRPLAAQMQQPETSHQAQAEDREPRDAERGKEE
jgi:predicted acylesterase/phospholipase RssA